MMIQKIIFIFFAILLFSCNENSKTNSEKTLIIASKKADCIGVAPQECLLIKEDNTQKDWHFFYDQIKGFNYENGFEYKILVHTESLKNIPQDASSISYTLVKIISKEKKVSKNLPN